MKPEKTRLERRIQKMMLAQVSGEKTEYMTFFTYGIAVLANTGKLQISEAELEKMFKNEFLALTSIFGAPPNEKN